MRQFKCNCGNSVFFENTQCVACGSELGWCPACSSLRSITRESNGYYRCGHESCGLVLSKCHNYAVEHVCNRCVVADPNSATQQNEELRLCDYCQFNDTIPDLSVADNREKWLRLEHGKRRLLYTLDLLRLPYGEGREDEGFALSFDFKGDVIPERRWWWAMGQEERVYTGHSGGKITINLREADHVEREKARVSFNEAHRTIVGHFRHEIGHYYWDLLVKGRCEIDCINIFGNHEKPNYGDALKKYYSEGPPADWHTRYISSYAAMHPWEDFAETFATYLDMVTVLDTAQNMGFISGMDVTQAELETMTDQYTRLGVLFNEMNRSMGLLDLVPKILGSAIIVKLSFIHNLLRNAAK